MTQLLISVKSLEECLLARYADVDVIDLKDPAVGALGALDGDVVSQIVQEINGGAIVSATVGEGHESVEALVNDIELYAGLGVDVVKIGASELFYQKPFFTEMHKLTKQGIKLVTVFFADKPLAFNLIEELKECGFYGAMLDTQVKQYPLLEMQPIETLKEFVLLCKQHHLISGLAGSVGKTHMSDLLALSPDFVGLRGGVCEKKDRKSALSYDRVVEIKSMLLNYNSSKGCRVKMKGLSLHV
jgi:(5-formylfuran-3-yl)methyl phosphate synthase